MFGRKHKPDRVVLQEIEEGKEEVLVHLFERNYVSAKNMGDNLKISEIRIEEALRTAVADLWISGSENVVLIRGRNLDELILERTKELLESKEEHEEDFIFNSLSADEIEGEKLREASKYLKYVPDVCRRSMYYYYVEKWPIDKIAAKLDMDEEEAGVKLRQCQHKYAQLIKRNFQIRNLID